MAAEGERYQNNAGRRMLEVAKQLHATLLRNPEEDLDFLQPSIRQTFVENFPHLFTLEDGMLRPLPTHNAKRAVESGRKRVQRIAVQFYNECLRGKQLVLKRCEDRNQFTQELYRWKDSQRQKSKRGGIDLRGVAPSAVIYALKTQKLLLDKFEGEILVWKETETNSRSRKQMTRQERVIEAVQRVREAQGELQKNRKNMEVDQITFDVAEDDVTRAQEELSQTVWIRNNSMRSAVQVKVQSEIANRRGFQVEGSTTLNIAPGSRCSVDVKYIPRTIGVVKTMIPFDFECCAEPPYFTPFTIVRYITVRCGDPDDHEILKPIAPYQRKKAIESSAFRDPEQVEKSRRTRMPVSILYFTFANINLNKKSAIQTRYLFKFVIHFPFPFRPNLCDLFYYTEFLIMFVKQLLTRI